MSSAALSAVSWVKPLTQVGFETEGTAIYDTMRFVKNEVSVPFLTYAGDCVRSAVPSTGSNMHGCVLLGSDVAVTSWIWHCFKHSLTTFPPPNQDACPVHSTLGSSAWKDSVHTVQTCEAGGMQTMQAF